MKKLISSALALAMICSLTACSGSSSAPGDTSNPSGEASLGVDEIKIGIVAPQTGSSANLGVSSLRGVELAVEDINAEGGIAGVPVTVVYRDDAGDPTRSLTYTEELIYNEEVDFLIGQANSACAAATVELTNAEKVIVVHNCASTTAAIDAEKYPYSFRVNAPNHLQAEALVNLALESGFTEALFLGDTSDLGITGIASLEQYAQENGLTSLGSVTYVANDADLSAVANAIQSSGAKCVLSFALGVDAAKIMTALDRIGYLDKVTLLGYTGTVSPSVSALTQDLDLGTCYGVFPLDTTIPAGSDHLLDLIQPLYEKINERFGHFTTDGTGRTYSTGNLMRAYDAVQLIKFAVEGAGTLDPDAVSDYIEQHGSEFESFIGPEPYRFSPEEHDGFNPDNMVPISLTEKPDDGVNYFGDVYVGVEITPIA